MFNVLKTIRMPFFSAEGGGGDDNLQESDKTFTQADLDRIVGERLAREKSKVADYDDLKEVAETLKAFGYEGSIAETKVRLKMEAEARRKTAELQELEEEAENEGTSPKLLAEIKALKKEIADIKEDKTKQQKAVEDQKKADEKLQTDLKELTDKYPEVDFEKLDQNKKFVKFIGDSKPGLTLLQLYENYIDLIGDVEKAAIEKIKANDDRSTFSGKAKADPAGGTYGLSDYQQKLAKENGMTNKEFAELRNQVKK